MLLQNTNKKKYSLSYSGGTIDIVKFVLSLLVVVIHFVNIPILSPILRCAVPLFFMLSSFFFFRKYDTMTSKKDKYEILKQYIKRNLALYFFWFIVLFPYTIMFRGWFDHGLAMGCVKMCQAFFFSGTFPASWYIMSSIVGISFISLSEEYLGNKVVFTISLFAYAFCCMTSNYGHLLSESGMLNRITSEYIDFFSVPYNSFPVSLLWIYIGRYLSKKEGININTPILFVALLLSLVFIYIEYFLIHFYGWAKTDDCYFMLVPVCFFVILLLGRARLLPVKPILRKASTIIYCSHLTIGGVILFAFNLGVDIKTRLLLFLIIVLCCMFITRFVLKWEKTYRFLSYAY